jgi:hypothetical protein
LSLKDSATTSSLSNYQTTASMAFYATQQFVLNAVDGLVNQDGLTAVSQSYVTKTSMSAYQTVANMSTYVTTTSLASQLANYSTTNSLCFIIQFEQLCLEFTVGIHIE